MKKFISMACLTFSLALQAKPTMDIAILLDTSGSMQGLIDQVRDGLWKSLNNLGEVKKNGEVAQLRLALYEYGSGTVNSEANYIQQLVPLTLDHMSVAEKLFATKATGSEEYSGLVISQAASDLAFSLDTNDFKAIVLAGNETIYQGPKDPIEAAKELAPKEILLNTIFAGAQTRTVYSGPVGGYPRGGYNSRGCSLWSHCPAPNPQPAPAPVPAPPSDPQTEINPEYAEFKELASIGGGLTLNIDHNDSVPYIESPYDDKIITVTESITETYLPYGSSGVDQYNRMRNLDRQVRGSNDGSYIGWGSYRSGNYGQTNASTWDLVSSYRGEDFDISDLKEEDFPSSLQGKTESEKIALIKKMHEKRESLENELAQLQTQRKEYVDKKLSELNDTKKDFSEAFKEMIVNQLKTKGFTIKL